MRKLFKPMCVLFALAFACQFVACGKKNDDNKVYTVHFEVCSDLPTNVALDQKVKSGRTAEQPDIQVRGANPDGKRITGWYEDENYTTEWDFGLDKVTSDITLYAKWASYYKVNFYIKNQSTPVHSTEVKSGRRVSPCDDAVCGYKIKGYYTSDSYSADTEFDFTKPVTGNTNIYIDTEDYFYFDAMSMVKNFRAVAAPSGKGSTAGSISYEEKDGEDYIRANFGYSTNDREGAVDSDPFIAVEGLNVDISKSQIIEMRFKNLGKAKILGIYWIVKNENGDFIGQSDYNSAGQLAYIYSSDEMNRTEDDEWTTIRINVASGENSSPENNWGDATRLYALRIQSYYLSESANDTSNEMLIQYVKGVYDENYDKSKTSVKFDIDGVVREVRTDNGKPLAKEKIALAVGGYEVAGYYKDAGYTQSVDIENEIINGETTFYVKTAKGFTYDAVSMYNAFTPVASTKAGSKPGTATLEDGFVRVNFGYSLIGDPSYTLFNARLNIEGVKRIKMKVKNLGQARQIGIYWVVKDANGNYTDGSADYTANASAWYVFKTNEKDMAETDEWIEITFDLSGKESWVKGKELIKIRFQFDYVSADENDLSNVALIAEITGEA